MLNVGSGAQKQHEVSEILVRLFSEQNVDFEVQLAHRPQDLVRLAKSAVNARRSMVIAGGGDGTISTVASIVAGTETILGLLPCGTFNYFARLLGVPTDPEQAMRACLAGEIQSVSLGEVNGRIFLNNASMGLYPSLLREREESYRRFGRRSQLIAYLSAAWGLVRLRPYLDVDMMVDGREKKFLTPLIFAVSNPDQVEEFGMPGAPCLDQGKLAFYVLPPVGRLGLLRLGWRMVRRKLVSAKDFQLLCSEEAHVHTRRRTIMVAYDGEFERMESPLVFRLRQDALRVLVPRSTPNEENAA